MNIETDPGRPKMCWYCRTHEAHYLTHDDENGELDICACCYGERIDPAECAGQGPCSFCGEEFAHAWERKQRPRS